MKKGSLVRIRSSDRFNELQLSGKVAVVLHTAPYSKYVLRICFLDGHKQSFHRCHLEVICEGK